MAKVHAVLCASFESASYKITRQKKGNALWSQRIVAQHKDKQRRARNTYSTAVQADEESRKIAQTQDVTVRSPLADADSGKIQEWWER